MIFETDNGLYAYKTCKCHYCGTIRQATFTFDYYCSAEKAPDGHHYLMCEHCMMKGRGQEPKPEPAKPGYAIDDFNVENLH